MKITCDWHIHSEHSCDSASMPVWKLPKQAAEYGIIDYGITDHLQSSYNLPDIAAARESYLATNPSPHFHFGIEVSCMSEWELEIIARGEVEDPVWGIREGGPAWGPLAIGITEKEIEEYSLEYVIGGAHWPFYIPFERELVIRDYHRQYMFLAEHPLVDIVAHPWWWQGHWQNEDGMFLAEPWFDDFGHIPMSMHDELASAAIQNNKAIEFNIGAFMFNPHYPQHSKDQYMEYLAYMKSKGVTFSLGSDCHGEDYTSHFDEAAKLLDQLGIADEDLWRLPPNEL